MRSYYWSESQMDNKKKNLYQCVSKMMIKQELVFHLTNYNQPSLFWFHNYW